MIYFSGVETPSKNTAGAKAPADIVALCRKRGYQYIPLFSPDPKYKNAKVRKVIATFEGSRYWREVSRKLGDGDVLVYQHPVFGWMSGLKAIPKLKKKGVKFVALIHDLESLRKGIAGVVETSEKISERKDVDFLQLFDVIICHNEKMKQYMLTKGFKEEQLVVLGIFDYLTDGPLSTRTADRKNSVNIAGNLAKAKCGYVYEMTKQESAGSLTVHLYGINFNEEVKNPALQYHGSFKPEELPEKMEGGFGVVWDGNSADSCVGNTGEYLKYNNPHKLSLYMASGLPVIIWEKAALADFVKENHVGLAVASLKETEEKLRLLSDQEYAEMCENASKISALVRSGHYFYHALDEALERLHVRAD